MVDAESYDTHVEAAAFLGDVRWQARVGETTVIAQLDARMVQARQSVDLGLHSVGEIAARLR